MLKMAKADLYRLLHLKTMYICIVALAVMYAFSIIGDAPTIIATGYDPNRFFGATERVDVRMIGANANYYFLMLFPASALLLSDFNEKTIKNTLSSVTTKTKYFIYKFFSVEFVGMVLFLIGNTAYYFVRLLVYGSAKVTPAGELFSLVLWQVPTLMLIISVFVLCAFWIRRAAVFNTVLILVPSIWSICVGAFLQINVTKNFAESVLVNYDFTNIFQYIAASGSTKFHIHVALISLALAAGVFFAGLRMFNHSEIIRD